MQLGTGIFDVIYNNKKEKKLNKNIYSVKEIKECFLQYWLF